MMLQSESMPPPGFREFDRPVPDTGLAPDPVGALEIGERLGYESRSIHMMLRRGIMPEPDYESVNGTRAWEWTTILWWAGETGRLRTAAALDQYHEAFGDDPPIHPTRMVDGVTVLPDPEPDTPTTPSRRRR